jgi:hypothetical protein
MPRGTILVDAVNLNAREGVRGVQVVEAVISDIDVFPIILRWRFPQIQVEIPIDLVPVVTVAKALPLSRQAWSSLMYLSAGGIMCRRRSSWSTVTWRPVATSDSSIMTVLVHGGDLITAWKYSAC